MRSTLVSIKIVLVVLLELRKANKGFNLGRDALILGSVYNTNNKIYLCLTIVHEITPVLVPHSLTSISQTDGLE